MASRLTAVLASAAVLALLQLMRPAFASECPAPFFTGRGVLVELYVGQECPACADAVRRLEALAPAYPALVAVLIPDRPALTEEEAIYARREGARRERRRARLGFPVAIRHPHLLLRGSEVAAAGAAPGNEALGSRVAAALAETAGLAPVLGLSVEPVPVGASAPGVWRVRVAPIGDAPSRGAGREVFIGLARTRSLAGGGSIHELEAWQGPLRLAPAGHLTLDLQPARAGKGLSVLVFIRGPAAHGVTDVAAVPLCPGGQESGGPRTIRP